MFSLFTVLELQLIFDGTINLFSLFFLFLFTIIIAKACPFLLPNLQEQQTTYFELPVIVLVVTLISTIRTGMGWDIVVQSRAAQ